VEDEKIGDKGKNKIENIPRTSSCYSIRL